MRPSCIILMFVLSTSHIVAASAAERECMAPCDCPSQVCCPHIEIEKVTKSCWEIGHRDICIPPIRFPWSKCCKPGCGRVRTVNVLKKREWECEKPKHIWTPVIQQPCDSCTAAAEVREDVVESRAILLPVFFRR